MKNKYDLPVTNIDVPTTYSCRYLQRKRDLKENEKRAEKEKEMFEEERRRRFIKVSYCSQPLS